MSQEQKPLPNHWKKVFNYKYLGSWDIEDGKDLVLTIKSMAVESVTNPQGVASDCLVAHFVENKKPMILNKVNNKMMQKLYRTPNPNLWIGKRMQVFVKEDVSAFGSLVDALRIRDFIPKATDKTTEKKTELKAGIRTVLAELQPIDMKTVKGQLMSIDDVKTMLNNASKDKSDTVDFLQNVLNDLKA